MYPDIKRVVVKQFASNFKSFNRNKSQHMLEPLKAYNNYFVPHPENRCLQKIVPNGQHACFQEIPDAVAHFFRKSQVLFALFFRKFQISAGALTSIICVMAARPVGNFCILGGAVRLPVVHDSQKMPINSRAPSYLSCEHSREGFFVSVLHIPSSQQYFSQNLAPCS
jgi:hypothetical protein